MVGKFRKFMREVPKVTTLLVFGALILFPMYMMFALSFMTPAQLERFPWFPLPIDVPRQVDTARDGLVTIVPASLELHGEGRPATGLTVPVDRRFQVELLGAGVADTEWTATAGPDGRVVVAQLQSANVWDVTVAPDGQSYLIDGEPFTVPEGFKSLLPGVGLKARALKEIWVVDEARRNAVLALDATGRVEPDGDQAERLRLEKEAVRQCLQTELLLEAAGKAAERARTLAREALLRWHVSAEADIAASDRKLSLTRLTLDRAKGRAAEYLARHEAEIRPLLEPPNLEPVAGLTLFRVDRREVVAELVADAPVRVVKTPGQFAVATQWGYPKNRQRLLRVVLRKGLGQTGPEGRPTEPGKPLADLVANRDVELQWTEGQWQYEGEPFAGLVPVGFEVALPKDSTAGATHRIAAGTVLDTLTEPKVEAAIAGNGMLVALAVARTDAAGQTTFTMPFGEGRWAYDLRQTRDMPFAIRTTVGRRDLASGTGQAKIAEFFVNRPRTVVYDRALAAWVEKRERVALTLPQGFRATANMPAGGDGPAQPLAAETVLGELYMPEARVVIDDEFLVVTMTGSSWGNGQWAYPIGQLGGLETLQVDAADVPQMKGGPQWELPPSAESGGELLEAGGALRGDAVLVVKAIRKTMLRYVSQRWHVDGRPIDLWFNQEVLDGQRDQYRQARTRLENIERRMGEARAMADTDAAAQTLKDLAGEKIRAEANRDHIHGTLLRLEKSSAFLLLSGPEQVLSSDKQEVIVEAGAVLAVLVAEQPYLRVLKQNFDADIVTHVAQDKDGWRVSFTHQLELPARANVLVAGGQQVVGGETLGAFFSSQWLNWGNYREAWVYVRPFILNTVITAVVTMVLSLFFASLSAFVFSRFEFPGKAFFYGMIIVLLMIPGVLNLVPLFSIVKGMGLLEQPLNLLGYLKAILVLVLPAVAGGQIMNVYIMRNNLETLAKDLFDAARIDGASNFQTYWHIAVPLSRPIMGTLAIFALLSQWNNFIWPWTVIKEKQYMTVTAGLALLEGQNLSDYGLQMAGAALASLPLILLFFFTMNLFIRGIQSGAIKA